MRFDSKTNYRNHDVRRDASEKLESCRLGIDPLESRHEDVREEEASTVVHSAARAIIIPER